MSKKNTNPVLAAIENVNSIFEDYKEINDKRLDAEAAGNEARAKELSDQLDKCEVDIAAAEKKRRAEEKNHAIMTERVEILEAANDRPRATIQDKAKSEYKDAFVGWMRSGGKSQAAESKMVETAQKANEVKAVTIGSDPGGGYAVPEEIAQNIDKLLLKQSDIQNEITQRQVGTSDYKELLTIFGADSGWVGETGTRSETGTSTLREIVPTWGELYAYPKITTWSAEDIFFDVESWLTEEVADGMGKNLDLSIWSGNGSSKPTGLINSAPTNSVDGSPQRAAAVFQYVPTVSNSPVAMGADDIIDLQYSLNRGYRNGAKFGCNSVTQGALRKLKDTNGAYYWQPSLQAGQPAMLLGYPVFTYADMADYNTGSGIYLGFGDWKKAFVLVYRNNLGITSEGITTPGYIKFYVRRRYAGIVKNNDAVKFLKLVDA